MSKPIKAAQVSLGLSDAGYESLGNSGKVVGHRPVNKHSEDRQITLVVSPRRGFRSQQDGDEAVLTRYFGSAGAEEEMLSRYTRVLENMNCQVTVEDDPEREGRKMLRVTRP